MTNSSSLTTFLSYEDWKEQNPLCDEIYYEEANTEPWIPDDPQKPSSGGLYCNLFFDRDTKRIEPSMHNWLQRSGGRVYWEIKITEVEKVMVRTLWRGIGRTVFETGVFIDGDYNGLSTIDLREAEALETHARLVKEYL